MQLVVKVEPEDASAGTDIIGRAIRRVLSADLYERTRISKVFPDVSSGRRAGLFAVELPDDMPKDQLKPVLRALNAERRISYSSVPESRRPL